MAPISDDPKTESPEETPARVATVAPLFPIPGPAPRATETPAALRTKTPAVTLGIIAICVAVCASLNLAPKLVPIHLIAPSAVGIWHGAVWGLVTSAFVHLQVWHLGFNMWWARDFGRLMEPKVGRGRFIAFVLAAAFVSSGWQLLVSGNIGIGFSGVVYALFGFMVALRTADPEYAALLSPRTIRWLLGWLVLCVVLTIADVWNVANGAHVSGLVFGWLIGRTALEPRRRIARSLAGALVVGAVMSAAYMPWSEPWRERDALLRLEHTVARADAGDAQAQQEIGTWYVHYPERREEGVVLLRRSADAGNVAGMNSLAWLRATCTDPNFRSAEEAVQWASAAEQREPNATYTDTLAAAYAEAQRWRDAVDAENKAIERLEPNETELRKHLEAHLALLLLYEPIRE